MVARMMGCRMLAPAALCAVAVTAAGGAEGGGEEPGYEAAVRHLPLAEAKAGKNVEICVDVTGDWKMEELTLIYRKTGMSSFKKAQFKVSSSGSWVAVVMGGDVSFPGFEYAIWVKEKGMKGRFAVASAQEPHPVVVHGISLKDIKNLRLKAYHGTTSSFFADYSFSWFGRQERINRETGATEASVIDHFHRAEFGYSYRLLSILHSFYFGFGIVRGQTMKDGKKQWVGIDYGFARVLLEFHRYIALEPRILFGGSEEGFDWGGGAVLRLGNTLETHADIGFEIISTVGSTVLVRFAWDTVRGFQMGLNAELTNFPSSASWGTRIYCDVNFIGYKYLGIKGTLGYASRNSAKGGIVAGLAASVNF
ncbi:MAG: hypothetical protein ABIJ56_22965 [Pseudomonadota bacterium]